MTKQGSISRHERAPRVPGDHHRRSSRLARRASCWRHRCPPLFWAVSQQATLETPAELRMSPGVVDTPQRERQRLDWQTKRAIVLARQALQPAPAAAEPRSAPNTATAAALWPWRSASWSANSDRGA